MGGLQHPLFAPVRLDSDRSEVRSSPRARNHLYRTMIAWARPAHEPTTSSRHFQLWEFNVKLQSTGREQWARIHKLSAIKL